MDFLKIRKKARERAAAGRPAKRAAPGAPPAATPRSDPVMTDADVLDGELAARLQGLPAPAPERFAVWRPGAGDPPPAEAAPSRAPHPREDDPAAVAALRGALHPIGAPPADDAPAPRDPLDDFFYREDEEAPPVPTFATAADAAPGDGASVALAEYLTFALGGETYALPIAQVREVLKAPPVTEVPRAPSHVLGVVTVRGEVVAVCDPRRRLALPGAPPGGPAARLVVVDAGEGPCALLVDSVAGVVRVARGGLEPCPQGIGGAAAECLAGIGRDGDRLFTALDPGALLKRAALPARGAEEDRRAGA